MTKLWFIYLTLFVSFTFIDQVGQGNISVVSGDDANAIVAYNVDEVSSGAGDVGLIRQGLDFAKEILPKFILWNYGFMTGPFEIVQYIFITIFGGLILITVAESVLGLLRRNV